MLALALGVTGLSFLSPSSPVGAFGLEEHAVEVPVAKSEWTFQFAPYYWSASISGNLAVEGHDVDVEGGGDGFFGAPALSGYLGHFEAHHGPWSFVIAPIFIQADMKGSEGSAVSADLTISAQLHEAFVAREFATGWEWMIGARYQEIDTSIDLSSGGSSLGSLDSSHSWIDPIVGLRYHTDLGRDWWLHARADAGGFGVGSDLALNASLMASYQVSPLFGVNLGYRALTVDFQEGGGNDHLSYDLSMYGPIIGISFSF
jgi:hypothetical protein